MQHRFAYQPPVQGAIIFWGLIVAFYGLAVTLAMETVSFSWSAIIVAVLTTIVAAIQISRYQARVTDKEVRLYRVLPSNTLIIPSKDLTITIVSAHRLKLTGTPYGELELGTWRKTTEVAKYFKTMK